jgi:D-aminopeptidase
MTIPVNAAANMYATKVRQSSRANRSLVSRLAISLHTTATVAALKVMYTQMLALVCLEAWEGKSVDMMPREEKVMDELIWFHSAVTTCDEYNK